MIDAITRLDLNILHFIQDNLRIPFLDFVLSNITHLVDAGIFWIALAVLFLFFRKTRKTGISMGVALILGLLICNIILKPAVARIRPYDLDATINCLVRPEKDLSFPSGHAIASTECALVMMYRDKRYGIPALIFALIIIWSRLYVCVHYPTDVIAAVILGIGTGIAGIVIVNFVYRRFVDKKETGKSL